MSSDETKARRFVNRLSISLAVVAELVALFLIGAYVTLRVVTRNHRDLHSAVDAGDVFAVRCFLWMGSDVNGWEDCEYHPNATPLMVAVAEEDARMVAVLVKKGADLDRMDQDGVNSPLIAALLDESSRMVKLLVSLGADVNKANTWGGSPLHFAVCVGCTESAALLIEKGARVNAKADNGETPLHDAAIFGKNQVAELLIAKGADVNAKGNEGKTPLHIAKDEVMRQLLMELGAVE